MSFDHSLVTDRYHSPTTVRVKVMEFIRENLEKVTATGDWVKFVKTSSNNTKLITDLVNFVGKKEDTPMEV